MFPSCNVLSSTALFPILLIRTIFATDEIRNRRAYIARPSTPTTWPDGIYDSICPAMALMSGQRSYERRIDKNVRGLFAGERTQTPFFYLSRFSPDVPWLSLRLFFSSFSPILNVTLVLSAPLHLTLTNFLLFLSPSSIYAVLFSLDNVRSYGRVYCGMRSCIRPGNRLGFVKVECIGENRSSPYKKRRNEALGVPRGLAFF